MSRIELAPELLDDFDQIFDPLASHGVADLEERIQEIVEALDALGHHPLIGHPVAADRRELIIEKGSRGYVALYHYLPLVDMVLVLAIRNQREAGYARP